MTDCVSQVRTFIQDFLNGDSEAYRVIRSRIRQYLHRHNLSDDDERNDLTSEITQILVANFAQGKFRGDNVKALNVYIYRIVNSRVCRHLRNRMRERALATLLDHRGNPGQEIDEQAARRDLAERIVESLDGPCRELIDLKFGKGLSDQEIADRVRKSKNAVSTALSRCIKKAQQLAIVREILKELGSSGH